MLRVCLGLERVEGLGLFRAFEGFGASAGVYASLGPSVRAFRGPKS